MTADSTKAAVAYVADEYAKEWQRKNSLETRALAVATGDFALVTLFGVWIDRLKLLDDLATSPVAKWVCIVALGLAVVAFALALAGALLFRFKGVPADDIDAFLDDVAVEGFNETEIFDEIARTYLGQLRAGRDANKGKFLLTSWAVIALLAGVVGAGTALVVVGG